MNSLLATAAGLSVVAVLGGSLIWTQLQSQDDALAACRTGTIAGGTSAIGGPFTLISETGELVTDADIITRPSLIYFGYTFCPDVCPFDLVRNAEAVDLLDDKGLDVLPVFITIDPERDTPSAMAEFTEYTHEKMIGLTGSPEQIKAASTAYRTYYKQQPSEDPEFYLVDHSTFTYLVFPETGFVEYFRREDTPEAMADRVACFMDALEA